jgi:sarcosine/dimethylglycine N-methyltransferase
VTARAADVTATAREYYNSDDADRFYCDIWGGEDIHIGIYRGADEAIARASARTVATMAHELVPIGSRARIADFGAGYGGSARWLARAYGCHVSCVNLSEVQNERNRQMTEAAGLGHLIDVHDASFEDAPLADGTCDHVWSQDSLLHAGDRERALREAARVLKAGGTFIFTDPMQADDCPAGVLEPVLDRLKLDTLSSFNFYRNAARDLGWTELLVRDLTPHLVTHYTRVRQDLSARRAELEGRISAAYIDRTIAGLAAWIDAGARGHLAWGILHFRK